MSKISLSSDAIITDFGYSIYLSNINNVTYYNRFDDELEYDEGVDISDEGLQRLEFIYFDGRNYSSNINSNGSMMRELWIWKQFLLKKINNKGYECVLIHNHYRWVNAVVLNVCKELNIDCLILERGYFRPFTSSYLFWSGEEKCFISPFEAAKFEKDIILKSKKNHSLNSIINNFKFIIFLVMNKVGYIFGIGLKIQERDFSVIKYIKLLGDKLLGLKKSYNFRGRKVILVGLQLVSDSNFQIFSGCRNQMEYINKIINAYELQAENFKRKYELIFKFHPDDMNNYRVNDLKYRFFRNVKNIEQLESDTDLFITINSSYVINMLMRGKKILCINGSNFSNSAITYSYTYENLHLVMRNVLADCVDKTDAEFSGIDKILKNQLPFDLFNYKDDELRL